MYYPPCTHGPQSQTRSTPPGVDCTASLPVGVGMIGLQRSQHLCSGVAAEDCDQQVALWDLETSSVGEATVNVLTPAVHATPYT